MKIEITEGVVTNEGAELGIIQDGTCHLTMQCAPIIKGAIRTACGDPTLKFLVGEKPDTEDAPGPVGSDGPVGQEGNPGTGFSPDAPPPSAPPPQVDSSNLLDPKPARDLIRGDKCPLLIAWTARQQKGGK